MDVLDRRSLIGTAREKEKGKPTQEVGMDIVKEDIQSRMLGTG